MTTSPVTRRTLLGALGVGAASAAAVAVAPSALAGRPSPGQGQQRPPHASARYDFHGAHQPGIATPQQENVYFASLAVTTTSRTELISVLRTWTGAAAAMMRGEPAGTAFPAGPDVPTDTGEAADLPASGLTITFGFGPTLFRSANGVDRFGIAAAQPRSLTLHTFPNDQLDPALVGGDMCIQACADDIQVAEHAVRMLVRLAQGAVRISWAQTGFAKTSTLSNDGKTPRNLFGFKDGTANITPPFDLDTYVWVGESDGPDWMTGGSYLAVRKVAMLLEAWDAEPLEEQERTFGRTKATGAPLSGGSERTKPDFRATGPDGELLIPADSHMALAAPPANRGQRILRRGYNYLEGVDRDGKAQAGLLFIGFMRDLDRQFVPLQTRLSQSDLMNEYVRYIGSAVFAIPPGVPSADRYVGQDLFG